MEHKLFSDLIKNSRVKPDFFIVKKIDELDFPLKHIDSIKKNINMLLYESFSSLVDIQKKIIDSSLDIENPFGSEKKFTIELDGVYFEINAIKNKKECPTIKPLLNFDFDDRILDKDFIDKINKRYILFSLVFAISFEESLKYMKSNSENYNLNFRFVIDEIISFWTNNFKNDFSYLDFKDIKKDKIYNHMEIEYSIIQFYFNYYKNLLIDNKEYSTEQSSVLNRIVEDKLSYKWYLIFGITIWNKIRENFKNPNENLKEGLLRLRELDYKFMDNLLNKFMS
jgi:hypothetical protein